MWVNPLEKAGHYLDMINLMTYDAGPYTFKDTRKTHVAAYNPVEAYHAYRDIYKGVLNIGVETPPEAWGGNIVTYGDVWEMAKAVKANDNKKDGLFIWSLQKKSSSSMSTKQTMEKMCTELDIGNCHGGAGQIPS